jgi:hypothetical protein
VATLAGRILRRSVQQQQQLPHSLSSDLATAEYVQLLHSNELYYRGGIHLSVWHAMHLGCGNAPKGKTINSCRVYIVVIDGHREVLNMRAATAEKEEK